MLAKRAISDKFQGSVIDRLIYLNLPTLKYSRLRGDMIEVFKITHNIYDTPDLPFDERANTKVLYQHMQGAVKVLISV